MLLYSKLSKFFVINVRLERSTSFARNITTKSPQMVDNIYSEVISTAQGQLRGIVRTTVYCDSYYSFEGIPYAKPPLGELRFRAPQPAESWSGIRDCSEISNKPVQKNIMTGQIEGSEDCLYLNVYAKTLSSAKPLPVMVWIYGGSFTMGEGSRRSKGPDYFMKENVILVCFNYRLCSLGFLTLEDPELQVPGNAGLKDQVLALKWVKKNIAHFNGDANNITLFGESAGSASTHYMTVTERTRGLFHKAILMSGSILNLWACLPKSNFAYRMAKYHGYTGEDDDCQVLSFLCSLDAAKLVTHQIMKAEDHHNGCLSPFLPTVEPYASEDCVIPTKPIEMLQNAWGNAIPMIIGGTSFEGLLMYPHIKKNPVGFLKSQPELVLPIEVRRAHSLEENQQLAAKVLCAHFGDNEPSAENMLDHADIYTYKYFWHGFYRAAMARLAYATTPTYLYRFAFDSNDFSFHRIKYCGDDAASGVAHADDLPFLFYLHESWRLEPETPEYKTIQRMIGMWTAFAKSSDPNCKKIEPTIWKPLHLDAPYLALDIGNDIKMMQLPESEKLMVWDSLYKQEELFGKNLDG